MHLKKKVFFLEESHSIIKLPVDHGTENVKNLCPNNQLAEAEPLVLSILLNAALRMLLQ